MQSNPSVGPAAMAHILEHTALQYKAQMEQALGQPIPDGPLPPQQEFQLSQAMMQAAQQMQPPPQQNPQAQQMQQEAQLKQQELQLQQQELQQRNTDEQRKAQQQLLLMQQEQQKSEAELQNNREERASREKIALMKEHANTARTITNHVVKHVTDSSGGGVPPQAQPRGINPSGTH